MDEIKEIDIELPKKDNKEIKYIEKNKLDYSDITKSKEEIQEKKQKSWEEFLGRKLITEKEYEKLKRSEVIFKIIRYIGFTIIFLILMSLIIWFIIEYKNKESYPIISINNTNPIDVDVTPPSVSANVQINQTNPIQLNVTVNIDKVFINSTGV